MRIIIFEQDYSDINTIHNSIERLAKFKEYTIYQVLTTRKVQSILDYLESYVADSYFISIRPDQPETFDLAKHVRQQNPSTQIVLIIEEQTAEIQALATQIDASHIIEKNTKATLQRYVEEAFETNYQQYMIDSAILKKSIS